MTVLFTLAISSLYLTFTFAQTIPQSIPVMTTQQLYSALRQANKFGNTQIIIADGLYKTHKTLIIERDNIT